MDMKKTHDKPGACVPMPDFERLQFYYGRELTVADLQVEQQYFLEKLRLHTRCFAGTGIVCGLGVYPVPVDKDCESEEMRKRHKHGRDLKRVSGRLEQLEDSKEPEAAAERAKLEATYETLQREGERWRDCKDHHKPPPVNVSIDCGWAVDCEGREIIVRSPVVEDLRCLLSREDMREIEKAEHGHCEDRPIVELTVCYCEQQTYPVRPRARDNCDLPSREKYGRVREGYRFRVSLAHQCADTRCSNCCEQCEAECVVLARIAWPIDEPLCAADIDWRPRRELSVYQPTVIDGISWQHGAIYDAAGAKAVLGTGHRHSPRTDGIEVHFSKPVFAETLQKGVVDLWRLQGGKGLAGVMSQIEGSFVDKPEQGLIDHFKFRDDSGETLNSGDRVLIQVRGNFILDACCQPIDGEHVGGLVPQLPAYADVAKSRCLPPRPPCADRARPWTSGNGRAGATFESWFFIE
jgi:hypothetical protein